MDVVRRWIKGRYVCYQGTHRGWGLSRFTHLCLYTWLPTVLKPILLHHTLYTRMHTHNLFSLTRWKKLSFHGARYLLIKNLVKGSQRVLPQVVWCPIYLLHKYPVWSMKMTGLEARCTLATVSWTSCCLLSRPNSWSWPTCSVSVEIGAWA